MKIHKAGTIPIIVIFSLLIILNILNIKFLSDIKFLFYALILGSLYLVWMVLNFFRNPKRNIVINESVCISPADGTVVVIEETVENEYFKDKRLQVSIFMSVWNVHMNRYPVSGIVKYAKYHKGKYLMARNPKSSLENERTSTVVQNSKDVEIMFRQIAGIVARRIFYKPVENTTINQGDEMGFIRFGSRVDLFFPIGTKINVQLGEKVKGGISKIAEL